MFPIALDLTKIPVLLIGNGELLTRRLAQLEEAHAAKVTVREGELFPTANDIAAHAVIMVTGLSREMSEKIAKVARAAGKLVNVEDVNDLCDFYFTANVRRGDLVIAVSTSGASPTLARKVRDKISRIFGEEWTQRVAEIAALRKSWRAEGKSMGEVVEGTETLLKEKGWLSHEDAA